MKLPKRLFVTELSNGWKGIYSPYRHGLALLSYDNWAKLKNNKIEDIDESLIQYLVANNILISHDFEEEWLRKKFRIPEIKLNYMFLVTTLKCNLACKYCAVEGNLDNPLRFEEVMTTTTASLAIELFERQLCLSQPKEAIVTFYGGEPMLNKEVIRSSIPKINAIQYPAQKSPVQSVMITNGYLYDPEIAELFKKYNAVVCVSLDGMKHHQDAARVTRDGGRPTYDRIVENYKKYQASGFSMGIACTIGKHNAHELPEIAEFFAQELRPDIVQFQPPHQVLNEGNALWISVEDIANNIMDAYNILKSYGIVEGLTDSRYYRHIMNGTIIPHPDCDACGRQIVVAPDGMIGPCHNLVGARTFFEGNVEDRNCMPEKMGNFNQWAARFPLNMPACSECSFIPICGGGCPYNSYISTGSIWNKDQEVCKYIEKLIEWILKDIWKKVNKASISRTESKGDSSIIINK